MDKKTKKQNKESKTEPDLAKEAREIKNSAIKFLGEVEKSGEKLAAEVKQFFEQMADNAASVASTAAKTTVSMTEKVAGAEPGQHLSRVMDEVKEAGEVSMRAVGEGFDALRQHILDLSPTAEKKPKKSTAKKQALKKKPGTKKVSRKPAVKKKASTKKTTKKTAAKKQVSTKRTAKKKATNQGVKKAASKKAVGK